MTTRLYIFKETATIYTQVEADSEEEAWELLDTIEIGIPNEVDIDVHDCEIVEIAESPIEYAKQRG